MRKFALIFSVLFLFSLCACRKTEVPTYDPVCGDGPTVATEAKPEDPTGPVIETTYYNLTLPVDWEGKCVWEILDNEDETYTLNLYEVTAHEEADSGKLCSIILLPTSEDWAEFPNYTIHGILYTTEGDYQVIALYPTDVQFTESTMDAYNTLSEQIADVLCTISPTVGIEMVSPAPVI